MSVLVVGDEMALALTGPGQADTVEPRLVVALDDAPVPGVDGVPVLRWWRGAPGREPLPGERVVATDGDGLWSRAPWPVRDELFALAPAPRPTALVVEADVERRDEAVDDLRGRGLEAAGAARLTADGLAAADVVIHGLGGPGPLPGDAIAVLAAGRVLVADTTVAFGLAAGLDHLAALAGNAASAAESVLRRPEAFAAMRCRGRLAAGRHRADTVLARLLV